VRAGPGVAALIVLFLVVGCQRTADEQAIAEVIRLGGEVKKDGRQPGLPVIQVNLAKGTVTDSELRVLSNFPHLQKLDLRYTVISNRGLAHVKGLAELEVLLLDYTSVSDEGLTNLAELKNLRTVSLNGNPGVSLWGLGFLKKLPNLDELFVKDTAVTEEDVKQFRQLIDHSILVHYQ
jgi:hypothetical protein